MATMGMNGYIRLDRGGLILFPSATSYNFYNSPSYQQPSKTYKMTGEIRQSNTEARTY